MDAVITSPNGTPTAQTFGVAGASSFVLDPALAASPDSAVPSASFDGATGVPALTTAVFWALQSGVQGPGPTCHIR